MVWSHELRISLCVVEKLVFSLCNCTHLLGSPWQDSGRSRLPFPWQAPGVCLAGMNGWNVSPFQSLQWCVQGDKITKWPVLVSGLFVRMPCINCPFSSLQQESAAGI